MSAPDGGRSGLQTGAGFIVDVSPPIARVTIDRPDVRNAMSYDLAGQLVAALDGIDKRKEVRCVILSGSGERAFISGADVKEFSERLTDASGALAYDEALERLARRLETLSQPVIAAINGAAVGTGLLLALACDVRIAVEGAKFGVPVSKIGLVPSLPDVRRLVTFAGRAQAAHLLVTGEIIETSTALRRGLVDRVVPREELNTAVGNFAELVATRAPLSIAATKAMLDRLYSPTTVAEAADLYGEVYGSRDFREGVEAFLGKRSPVFEGK